MIFENWSRRLGLAATPLFGPATDSAHVAMLDGVAGSFVLSDVTVDGGDEACDPALARSWSWSSMMRHHVLVQEDTVSVTSAAGGSTDRIRRRAVEDDLEGFLSFIERKSVPAIDIVDHVIETFQALRAQAPGDDRRHLGLFLALLALRLEHKKVAAVDMPDLLDELVPTALRYGLDEDDLDGGITADLARSLYATLLTDRRSGREVMIDLTVRHAGAELFQAAQLAPPVRSTQGELFTLNAPPLRVRPHSLKEVAYTPVGLARILSEHALEGRKPSAGSRLVVMDPTCGSGSFLVEAIAALQRAGWKDPVTVAGYDISPTALATARFAVECARRDGIDFEVEAVIERRDFLDAEAEIMKADVVLMNPPFRAWPHMDREEQASIRASLGKSYSGRPDKSMAFVQRALEVVKSDATVTALLPGGVLASESGRRWRESLAKVATPRMVATLGDHTLFRFATVNVCALTLVNTPPREFAEDGEDIDVQMLWASELQGAASTALRTYRRTGCGASFVTAAPATRRDPSWNLYPLPLREVLLKPNWLPAPGLLSAADREAIGSLQTRVDDLFTVHTGIRAGERTAFILSDQQLKALPEREWLAFRPIAEKRAISEGAIRSGDHLFAIGEDLSTQEELKAAVPVYFKRHLEPAREALQARARSDNRWWRQSEPRNRWRTSTDPRIVSRQWFRNDGFAVDENGTYAVVQGFAWFPTPSLKKVVRALPDAGDLVQVLRLYTVMMSSDVFFRVAREYSTNAGGGQITLQQKHLNHVPMPVLSEVIARKPHLIDEILAWGEDFPPLATRNNFAAACYGFAIER